MVDNHYSFLELTDMHYCYGLANGRSREAQRCYANLFPNRALPHHTTFHNVHVRLRESGQLRCRNIGGRPRTTRTVQLEEEVLEQIENEPRVSTRQLAAQLNVDHMAVWRILNTNLFYPYHLQRVQGLLERDFQPRLEYCRWLLMEHARDRNFIAKILFTDESSFTREGILNLHNNHIWATENPNALVESNHQYQFKLNVWGAIIGDTILGPVFLPPNLNGDNYLEFLRNELPIQLENVPIATRIGMFFMHDGCPAHYSRNVREHLDQTFPERWIGRGGPKHWAARSPDHNPIDFYLWGHIKQLVYATPVDTIDILRERIIQAFETVRNQPGITERVRNSIVRRAEACIDAQGQHFEHFL